MSYFKYGLVVLFALSVGAYLFYTCRKFEGNNAPQMDTAMHIVPPHTVHSYGGKINVSRFLREKNLIHVSIGWHRIDGGAHFMSCAVKPNMVSKRCILHTRTSYGEFFFRMRKDIHFYFCGNQLCIKGT